MSSDRPTRYGPAAVSPSNGSGGLRFLVFLLVVAVGASVYQHYFIASFKPSPDRPGWIKYESRRDDWSVQFPGSWHRRRISNVRHGSPYTTQVQALALTNVDWDLKRAACGKNCWSPWVDAVGLPSNGIVVQIGWSYGGGFSCQLRHDTPLPVTLARAERTLNRDGAGGTPQLWIQGGFIARLRGYHVVAWVGSKATKADLNILDKIVASISYDPVNPAPPAPPDLRQNQC